MSTPQTIRLGKFEIHRIVEMEMPFLTVDEMFPAATREEVDAMLPRLQPWAVDAERRVLVVVQSYLVKTPDDVILLDTCVGCDKTNKRFDFWHKRTDSAPALGRRSGSIPIRFEEKGICGQKRRVLSLREKCYFL